MKCAFCGEATVYQDPYTRILVCEQADCQREHDKLGAEMEAEEEDARARAEADGWERYR